MGRYIIIIKAEPGLELVMVSVHSVLVHVVQRVTPQVQVSSLRALMHVTLQRNLGVGTSIMPSHLLKQVLFKLKRPYQINVMSSINPHVI